MGPRLNRNASHSASHISLVGAPGSGKTTTARALAAALGRPLVQLDRVTSPRYGGSTANARPGPPKLHGDQAWQHAAQTPRQRATQRGVPVIIDTGGGAMAHPGSRRLLQRRTTTVNLDRDPASTAQLLQHARPGTASHRTTMGSMHPAIHARRLQRRRQRDYAQADHRIRVTPAMTPHDIAQAISRTVRGDEHGT